MSDGFKVVPQSLRDTAKAFDAAAGQWKAANTAVSGATLNDDALGLLGRLSGFVTSYNSTVTTASGLLTQGETALHDAATKLGTVASTYENKDADYYAMFGYLQKEM